MGAPCKHQCRARIRRAFGQGSENSNSTAPVVRAVRLRIAGLYVANDVYSIAANESGRTKDD